MSGGIIRGYIRVILVGQGVLAILRAPIGHKAAL